MIRIAIAEDQIIIRESLKFLIEQDPDISVIACAANGKEAYEICRSFHPDVFLLNIVMPVMDGIEGTRIIKEEFPEIKILILTTFNEPEKIVEAMKKGADGYLLKDINPSDLILTIKSVASGLQVFHPESYQILKNTIVSSEDNHPAMQPAENLELTEKEKKLSN